MPYCVCGQGKPIVENTRFCRCECAALIRFLLPARTVSSADAQIYAVEAAPEAASGDRGKASEHSIEQIDPKAPGVDAKVLGLKENSLVIRHWAGPWI